jgi:hypothetical protein
MVDLFKVIDLMMTLPDELQNSFESKLTKYQKEAYHPWATRESTRNY